MSRRPLQHPIGRLAKAQSRMAPGGMVWSESPIPRKYSPRVPMLGEPPDDLLFWWPFDETTGHTAASVAHPDTAPTIGFASDGDPTTPRTPGWGAAPLAPGSGAGVGLIHDADTYGAMLGVASSGVAVNAASDGWVTVDVWLSRTTAPPSAPGYPVLACMNLLAYLTPGGWRLGDGTLMSAGPAVHLVCRMNGGATQIDADGVPVFADSWTPDPDFFPAYFSVQMLSQVGTVVSVDELRLFGAL